MQEAVEQKKYQFFFVWQSSTIRMFSRYTRKEVVDTQKPPSIGSDLTSREREILALMVSGFSNPEIAEKLVLQSAA